MVQYLDWKLINEIKSLKDEVISLNNKIEYWFNEVETKLDKLLEIISKKEMKNSKLFGEKKKKKKRK